VTFKVTASTMGQSSPASVAGDGSRGYRWRGNEDWEPNHPDYREEKPSSGPAAQRSEKAARLAEFAGYLADGCSAQQAGRLMGLAPKTARTYARQLAEQQRGEVRDGQRAGIPG